MDFYQPVLLMPVVESQYKELLKELKHARQLTQSCIKKAQESQKRSYDKTTKESSIKSADLVMMKVESKFYLNRTYVQRTVLSSKCNLN